MTLIASVVSTKGVAVIADSLVTYSQKVLTFEKFRKLIEDKGKAASENIQLNAEEILTQFESRRAYSKDYAEKLFVFDAYTVITTAGSALIDSKNIETIVNEIVPRISGKHGKRKKTGDKTIEALVKEFADRLLTVVKSHLASFSNVSGTTFIFSHWSPTQKKSRIFKVEVKFNTQVSANKPGAELVTFEEQPEWMKVVCDGQSNLCDLLLYGEYVPVHVATERLIQKMAADFGIESNRIPPDYHATVMQDAAILRNGVQNGFKLGKLTNLSLQQAVDLATLLLKIEVDFQKYTEDVQTVGGVVKLAVISDSGIEFLAGNKLVVST